MSRFAIFFFIFLIVGVGIYQITESSKTSRWEPVVEAPQSFVKALVSEQTENVSFTSKPQINTKQDQSLNKSILPVVETVQENEEKTFDRFEFRSQLSRKETASIKDLVILVSQSYKEERGKYNAEEWYEAFVKLGWISDELDLGEPCTRGQVGRLVAGRLNLTGNLFLKLFGPSERYGMREILRLRFLKKGYPNEYLSGSSLMNVQSKSTTWVKKFEGRYEAYKEHTTKKLKEAFAKE